MKGNLKRLICLYISFFLTISLGFPAFAEELPEESEESEGTESSISVSVYLEESGTQQYLIPPLTLSCPQGTTIAGLAAILKKYAYLSDYRLEDGVFSEIEILKNGEALSYGENGEWILFINNAETHVDDSVLLGDGDQVHWRFRSEYSGSSASEPSWQTPSTVSSASIWNGEYSARLTQATSWLKNNQTVPATLTSLGAAGISVDYRKIAALRSQIQEQNSVYATAALAASDVLAASFCGIPAGNVGGENLLAAVYDYPDISKGGSLSPAFALLALDCNGYSLPDGCFNTRSSLCAVLCSYQNEDGGFAPAKGEESAPGYTAFALTALSAYSRDKEFSEAILKGLDYLSAAQKEDGSFAGGGKFSSALATEAVIIALCATATPLDSPNFVQQPSVLDALLAFQTESGGFSPEIGTPAQEEATAGGVLALSAVKGSRNIFVLRTPISGEPAETNSAASEESESQFSPPADTEEQKKDISAASGKAILFGSLGLTTGILLGCLVLLIVILFYRRKFRRHANPEETSQENDSEK